MGQHCLQVPSERSDFSFASFLLEPLLSVSFSSLREVTEGIQTLNFVTTPPAKSLPPTLPPSFGPFFRKRSSFNSQIKLACLWEALNRLVHFLPPGTFKSIFFFLFNGIT